MRIGAVSYNPYIYNTNSVSASSLGKVSGIEEDLLTSGTDFTSMAEDVANENPLRMGETSNFMDVLQMQYQMGQMNASRLIKPAQEMGETMQQDPKREQNADAMMQKALDAYNLNITA